MRCRRDVSRAVGFLVHQLNSSPHPVDDSTLLLLQSAREAHAN